MTACSRSFSICNSCSRLLNVFCVFFVGFNPSIVKDSANLFYLNNLWDKFRNGGINPQPEYLASGLLLQLLISVQGEEVFG